MNKQKIYLNINHSYNLENEKQSLARFLDSEKLVYDPTILSLIELNDVVEVYSFPKHKQIYSNSVFKETCSYSDHQMKTTPFPVLFWRDDDVQKEILKTITTVCRLKPCCHRWNLADHDLIENLHPRKRTSVMHMKVLSPCFRNSTSEIASAYISTLQVEAVFEWDMDI